MGINRYAFVLAECIAEDDVCRFASDPGESKHLGHRIGNLAVEVGDDLRCGGADILCLVAEETRRADILLELPLVGASEVCRRFILFEKLSRDDIYPNVGTLGREDCRYKQLKRGFIVQRAFGLGVSFFEDLDDLSCAGFLVGF